MLKSAISPNGDKMAKKYSDKPWLKNYETMGLKKTLEPYPKVPLFEFLDESAKNFPNSLAYIYLGSKATYGELKLQVDKLATALADLGVKKGDRVATILPNSPQFVISDYAILKTGAANVPCSLLHKAPDLEYEVGESGTETIICLDTSLDLVNSIKDKTKLKNIIITSLKDYSPEETVREEVSGTHQLVDLIAQYEPNPPKIEINPVEDLAEVPFTGGATGLPKGVMLTHYNMVANVLQVIPLFYGGLVDTIRGNSSVLLALPFFHQYGHWAMHTAIYLSLNVLLVPYPRDSEMIIKLMEEHSPLLNIGVPTQFMRMAPEKIKDARIMGVSGAAPLPPEVADKYEEKAGSSIVEGYGLTETSPVTHVNLSYVERFLGFDTVLKKGSIGVPVPDTECRIVDLETGTKDVPFGELGELIIRGPQLMKGYWPTPEKGLRDGWLYTGDIAKMDEDGYFYIVDRTKDMINVSGMKVYSRVVDDVLFEHPAVEMGGAIGVPDPDRPGSERIKAFIKLKKEYEGKVTADDIIKHCREKLPPYAVPKFVEFRKDLPLTVTEKIFKRKLREEELKKIRGAGT